MHRTTRSYIQVVTIGLALLAGASRVQAAGWLKALAGPASGIDRFLAVDVAPAGGYIAVGGTTPSSEEVWLVRLDGSGNVVWQKRYEHQGPPGLPEEGTSVKATSDGGFIVAANLLDGHGSNTHDAWILKVDSAGEPEWQERFGGPDDDIASDIMEVANDGFAFVGTLSSTSTEHLWIVRLDPLGGVRWQRQYGFGDGTSGRRVVTAGADRIFVLGRRATLISGVGVFYDGLLVECDGSGQVLASRQFVGNGEVLTDLVAVPGGYVVTASGGNSPGPITPYTVLHRLNQSLGTIWNASYRMASSYSFPTKSIARADGSVVTIGDQGGPPWGMLTDANGIVVWLHEYTFNDGYLTDARADASGIVVVGATGADAAVGKLSPAGTFASACGITQDASAQRSTNTLVAQTASGTSQPTSFTPQAIAPAVASASAAVATLCADSDPDEDGVEDSQDNCPLVANPGQEDEDADGVGDACDDCPSTYDPAQPGDSDRDGYGDACDVCPLTPDPAQHDQDVDGAGDVCDGDDGLLFFTSLTRASIAWQTDAGFTSYNLYRGSLTELAAAGTYTQSPGSNPCASRACGLNAASLADALVPSVATPCFYLVSGNTVTVESDLEDPSSGPRTNQNPCP